MAQRDDGLDKLEAFNAHVAETRAVLQREAEKVADLGDDIEELGDRIDHELSNLGTTAREFDARYGLEYQKWCAHMGMSCLAAVAPGAGWVLGWTLAESQRRVLVATAEAIEAEYEAFPQQREEAVSALEDAERAASQAAGHFTDAMRAFADDVEPQSEPVLDAAAALRHVLDHHVGGE